MKYWRSLLLMLMFFLSMNSQAAAWWEQVHFDPQLNQLDGKKATDFNADWVAASFLSKAQLKKQISFDEYRGFIQSFMSFEKTLDMSNNGQDEIVRVGVYLDKHQQRGSFLAIMENGKVVRVFSDAGRGPFSALMVDRGQIRWYHCMDCRDYADLLWSGNSERGFVLERD